MTLLGMYSVITAHQDFPPKLSSETFLNLGADRGQDAPIPYRPYSIKEEKNTERIQRSIEFGLSSFNWHTYTFLEQVL